LYAQDLAADYAALRDVRNGVRGKGLKGAVGTSASYAELLRGTTMTPADLEARVMLELGLEAFPITHQTYPRRQDWIVISALAGLAITIHKLAFDVRLLQSPPIGEWAEPFASGQVGSSAMPFKRNPIHSENIDSLARYMASLPGVAWGNAADNLLERTLDDSANRRIILPQAFLCADELLIRAERVVRGLRIDDDAIQRTLARYGIFAATERLLMAAARAGGDRQALHEVIREHSLTAWAAVQRGDANLLAELLVNDARITTHVSSEGARALLDASHYVGDAPERAKVLARKIKEELG
jgi:adenylosuccinate lyase